MGKTIDKNWLDSLPNLQTLDLSSNQISTPAADTFFSLRNLNQNKSRTSYYSKLDVLSAHKPSMGATATANNSAQLLSTVAPPAQIPSNFFIPSISRENLVLLKTREFKMQVNRKEVVVRMPILMPNA